MSEAFDIYTLLFLVLAVVIFIRLRNVLGRRTGNERQPFDPYTTPDQKRPQAPKTNEPVVALPRGRSAPLPEATGPSVEDIEARLGSHAPKDSPLARSLTQLMRADPSFDPNQFLDGAKTAYEMIVMSFAEGDEASLKQLLSAEVFEGFESAIRERETRGEKVEFEPRRHQQGRHHRVRRQEEHRLRHRQIRERAHLGDTRRRRRGGGRRPEEGARGHRHLDLRARHQLKEPELEACRDRIGELNPTQALPRSTAPSPPHCCLPQSLPPSRFICCCGKHAWKRLASASSR